MLKILDKLFNFVLKQESIERPIFILGAPRSGTTLLYQQLARYPEVGFPKLENGEPNEGTAFWWHTFKGHRGIMEADRANSYRIWKIKKEYKEMLESQGKTRLLDKMPFMILWISLVNKVFPDARHFHIIRDGRAVVNSVLYKTRFSTKERDRRYRGKKLMYGPHPPELTDPMSLPEAYRYAKQWLLLVEHGRRNQNILGERYFELHYETLVSDTRNTMKKVLEHSQLTFDERFLTEKYPELFENRNYKWKSDRNEPFQGGWTKRRALEPEDMPHLEVMVPLLRALGYES